MMFILTTTYLFEYFYINKKLVLIILKLLCNKIRIIFIILAFYYKVI